MTDAGRRPESLLGSRPAPEVQPLSQPAPSDRVRS